MGPAATVRLTREGMLPQVDYTSRPRRISPTRVRGT